MAVPRAVQAGAKRIISINLKIGELSGVFPRAIEDCFKIAAKGSIAQEAKLNFEMVPVKICCRSCGYEGSVERHSYSCPECGSPSFEITDGRQYMIDSLEVE